MLDKKVVILGTGGTIAGKAASANDNIGYTAAQVGVEQLVQGVPGLAAMTNLVTEQVAQLDSKDMSFAVWIHLAKRVAHFLAREDVQGVVITHGTDTLEETAWFLQSVLAPDKPVVLTCAMRPATSAAPDGPQNVMDAVAVASSKDATGVLVACAGKLHGAADVQKVHTYQLDAFGSGDNGPLAHIEEGKIRWTHGRPARQAGRAAPAIKNIAALGDGSAWPWVSILTSCAGVDGRAVDALVAGGVRGIVVATTGNGTLHHDLEAALLKAQAAGVRVLRATRCLNGRIIPGANDAIPDSAGLTPVKARVALLLSLLGAVPLEA